MKKFIAYEWGADTGAMTGIAEDEVDSGHLLGEWFSLYVDGVRIGRCRMEWDRATTFEVELDEGHTMEARNDIPETIARLARLANP